MTIREAQALDSQLPVPSSPSRLYSLILKLRPVERGTLMPFSGELVHGAWLNWIRGAAPDVANALHDGNKRRLFTCSGLQFPLPAERMREAERENTHMPLFPEKTYTVRITLLMGELFPLFYHSLLHAHMSESGVKRPPFIQIGKQELLLEEVVSDPDDEAGWTDFTSFATLVDRAKKLTMGKTQLLKLDFASLTTFSRYDQRSRVYGNHYARLPLPQYVFQGLARRWEELAPPELAGMVQQARIEEYIAADGIVIDDYNLRSHRVQFVQHPQRGFTGTCTYALRGPDEEISEGSPLTVRQQLLMLAQLAFYCGVGYKTPMGMGQTRPLKVG